jgi:hypothetical protein
MASAEPTSNRPRTKRWSRRLAIVGGATLLVGGGLWYGVNRTAWMGPIVADGLRAVFGNRFVAFAEDTAYGIQDRINTWRYQDEPPKTFWEAPTEQVVPPAPPVPPSDGSASVGSGEPPFVPAALTPPYPNVAAKGDGLWTPIPDAGEPTAPPILYKTLIHPDGRRVFAALAIVALERSAVGLHLVAGTSEPESSKVSRAERPGQIPSEHHASLLAAFNGGFKATHGQFGMFLDGKEYLPPKDYACTFVHYQDGRLAIAPWSKLKDAGTDDIRYYRQTPPCLVQDGEVEKQVENIGETATGWGATVSGETVIRRSAIGISQDGKTLYYGIGDALTAQSLARGMRAAGSYVAAQLDVNYSYPRFLLYAKGAATPFATSSIIPAVEFTKDQYVNPSPRDFFYLTRERKKNPG